MEKRIIQKFNSNVSDLKQRLIDELRKDVPIETMIEMLQCVEPIPLDKTDFVKRRRTKNSVPAEDRCIAKSAKNDQCTRRKKTGHNCCGTHSKGVPHGFITANDVKPLQKEVWAEDINGIIYYIDVNNNVYKTEDIMKNLVNPSVIAKWSKTDSGYTIHWNYV